MPDPGAGAITFYYTNQQSSRFLFYHDHAWAITRLNVYAGEAAGYLIRDAVEDDLVNGTNGTGVNPDLKKLIPGFNPGEEIPLVIQDKTFVDANTIAKSDPTWNWGTGAESGGFRTPNTGDLWWPHVYMPVQLPYDESGINPFGRWHYGPWFWPPVVAVHGTVANPWYDPNNPDSLEPDVNPGVPHPSWTAEAFLDTPVVNGTLYPHIVVEPKAYRFRILNACHDRHLNLQLYRADPDGYAINGVVEPGVTRLCGTEVKMVPAAPTAGFPAAWPTDGREGGVPDPALRGPNMIHIGNESGFLPTPYVAPNQPVNWLTDMGWFAAGIVNQLASGLGPAERADVVIDFSQYAGQTLILYNDAPAAYPAADPRLDYFTGSPDRSADGGAPTIQAGYGSNTRTVLQIRVAGTVGQNGTRYDVASLQAAFKTVGAKPSVFKKGQDPILVGQSAYDSAYGVTFPKKWPDWGISRISDYALTFKTLTGDLGGVSANSMTIPMEPKAIQDEMGETFDDWGRMSANLGLEMDRTNSGIQTFVLQGFVDPPTEILADAKTPAPPAAPDPKTGLSVDGTQIWKITHNGVDTHPLHFHLYDVQLINRVDWGGFQVAVDPNERGWKETVRVSPLMDTIVALRPVAPKLPFGLPDSIRPLNPATPIGDPRNFTQIDPKTGQGRNIVNELYNFGWEYVLHCHILSHEEMDMMRPVEFHVFGDLTLDQRLPAAPVLKPAVLAGNEIDLTWDDGTPVANPATLGNPKNEIGFIIRRASVRANGKPSPFADIGTALANQTIFRDTTADPNSTYAYRVVAHNAAGQVASNEVIVTPAATRPLPPTTLTAKVQTAPTGVLLTWTDNAVNEDGFTVERSSDNGATFAVIANNVAPVNNTGQQTYTDANVVLGNTYTYRVNAFNTAGASDYSKTASVTLAGPPSPPANVTITQPARYVPRIKVTWTDSSLPANKATRFTVEWATNSGFSPRAGFVTTTANSYQTGTLARGRTYYFRVQASNSVGSSAWSASTPVSIKVQ